MIMVQETFSDATLIDNLTGEKYIGASAFKFSTFDKPFSFGGQIVASKKGFSFKFFKWEFGKKVNKPRFKFRFKFNDEIWETSENVFKMVIKDDFEKSKFCLTLILEPEDKSNDFKICIYANGLRGMLKYAKEAKILKPLNLGSTSQGF